MALEKIAAAVRDMAVDFVNELAGSEKTISSASFTFNPATGAPTISSITIEDTQVLFRCAGGAAGTRYQMDVKIAVSSGEEMVGRVLLRVL